MTLQVVTHSEGYRLLRADGDDVEGVGPRFISLHRLKAFACGDIDSLSDPREVDHIDRCPGHNSETNLQALDPVTHGRVTRDRAR